MSTRTSVKALLHSYRQFASSSRCLQNSSAAEGFAALQDIFKTPSSLPSEASSSQSPSYPGRPLSSSASSHFLGNRIASSAPKALGRGYEPLSLPPKVDPTLDLFTNLLMSDGKKADAQNRVSRILQLLQRTSNQPPLPLLQRAIISASPSIRLLSVRKSIKTVLSPRGLNERQRTRQGIMWILKAAERGRSSGAPFEERIAREIFAVLEGTSEVFKRVEEVHKVATANRSNLTSR